MSERNGSLLPALAALVAAAAGLVLFNTLRVDRLHERLASDLVAGARDDPGGRFEPADLEGLPDPARGVLRDGPRGGSAVRPVGPPGTVRRVPPGRPGAVLAADGGDTAVHRRPAGVRLERDRLPLPFVPVRVLDAYDRGSGVLRARLLSTVTVAEAGPAPDVDEGELVRYLGEAVWFPTALLPAEGVEWAAVDDGSARATIEDGGNEATVTFHFDVGGLVERVTAERYRQEADEHAPWTGHFRDYEERGGMLVPTEAEVEWNLPDGDRPYRYARVERIEHRPT